MPHVPGVSVRVAVVVLPLFSAAELAPEDGTELFSE